MRSLFILFLLTYTSVSLAQEIDTKKSSITFTVTNLGFEVAGTFRTFSGMANFDPGHLDKSRFEITIPVKSINTKNKMRDEHLQEEEFFHASAHPKITFISQKVVRQNNGFVVTGTLKIKGTSKQVSIPFTQNGSTLSGSFSLNRNDYNVGGSGFLDTVGDYVKIKINCLIKTNE